MLTIDTVPTVPRSNPYRHAWRVDNGRKLSGAGLVSLYVTFDTPDYHTRRDHPNLSDLVVTVGVEASPSAVDPDTGHTIYRPADPDRDETNRMDALVVNPLRVNGVPLRVYAPRTIRLDVNGDTWGKWYGSSPGIVRLGVGYDPGKVTDTARSAAWQLVDEIVTAFATPERVHAAVTAYYAGEITAAERALTAAQDALTAARSAADAWASR